MYMPAHTGAKLSLYTLYDFPNSLLSFGVHSLAFSDFYLEWRYFFKRYWNQFWSFFCNATTFNKEDTLSNKVETNKPFCLKLLHKNSSKYQSQQSKQWAQPAGRGIVSPWVVPKLLSVKMTSQENIRWRKNPGREHSHQCGRKGSVVLNIWP